MNRQMQKGISVHGGNKFISPTGSGTGYQSAANTICSKIFVRGFDFTYSPIQEHQDLVNSHNLFPTHFWEATKKAEVLRLEDTTLRVANRELKEWLSSVIQLSLLKRMTLTPSDYMTLQQQPPLVNRFRGLCIDEKKSSSAENGVWPGDHHQGYVQSPRNVMDCQSDLVIVLVDRIGGVERVSLLKNISVRSNGYLKTSQGVGNVNNGGRTRSLNRPTRAASPTNATVEAADQEPAVEEEVANQDGGLDDGGNIADGVDDDDDDDDSDDDDNGGDVDDDGGNDDEEDSDEEDGGAEDVQEENDDDVFHRLFVVFNSRLGEFIASCEARNGAYDGDIANAVLNIAAAKQALLVSFNELMGKFNEQDPTAAERALQEEPAINVVAAGVALMALNEPLEDLSDMEDWEVNENVQGGEVAFDWDNANVDQRIKDAANEIILALGNL